MSFFLIENLRDSKLIGHTLDTPPYAHSLTQIEADNVSDEYHSMDELYEHRMVLNVVLFNEWHATSGDDYLWVMKSKLHNDGTMFDGYFIVMAILNQKDQISYHYKLEYWDLFKIPEVDKTPAYDGHTSKDVIKRLLAL